MTVNLNVLHNSIKFPVKTVPAKDKGQPGNVGEPGKDGAKKGKPEASGQSAGSIIPGNAYYVSYSSLSASGDMMELIRNAIEQKAEIIKNILEAFNPKGEDVDAEKKIEEQKDLEKADEKKREIFEKLQDVAQEMQAILSFLSSPTSNPQARIGAVMADLENLAKTVSGLLGEAESALNLLGEIDSTSNKSGDQKNMLTDALKGLADVLKGINSTIDKVKNKIE